jgi:ElaB/YqjD/DUF883 family membrane-anchored ribosome-binding protein
MSRMGEANEGQAGLGETATQVGQNLREMGTQVRDIAAEKYNDLRDQATNYYEQGRQRATEWEQGVESYVKEKPIQSVLIAAGVGVLLGLLWKRH